MRDLGHEETEEVLKKIEKRISAEYRQAEQEIAAKLDDYMKRFAEKDKLKLLGVANGQITEEEYKQWRLGQVMIGKRWSEMRDSLAKDFANTSQIARSIAFDHIPEVYAINHDYGTFQVEKGSLTDTSYTLYDRQSIEQLYKNEDTFIPAPGRQVKRAINEGKQIAWDKKQVQSVMMQGLLQGESIPNIATRLAKSVGEGDRKAAIRNARTLTTGIENAGRVASYDRANAMGIKTKKQWLAALDMRTRHWHASLDGVSVANDKPFTNDYGKIMYPGDPEADPANIYNCRCTLIADIEGFENDLSDMLLRHNEKLGDMSYDEWKKGHYDMESDRITKQDEIAETMRYAYGTEYRKYLKNDNKNAKLKLTNNGTKATISASSINIPNNVTRAEIIREAINKPRPFYAEDLRNAYDRFGIKPKNDLFDVLLHGAPNQTEYEKKYIIDNETLYLIISGRRDWKAKDIRLLSCSTGKADSDGNCVAQYLADNLGVNVYAPIDVLNIGPQGLSVGKKRMTEEEGFKWFHPRKEE